MMFSNRVYNNRAKVSKTARTSSRIMKTEVLMREPYTITMIIRLFSIVPIPHIVRLIISIIEWLKSSSSFIGVALVEVLYISLWTVWFSIMSILMVDCAQC